MTFDPFGLRQRFPVVSRFSRDNEGLAAVEFAFILPLMLTLIFGIIDASTGIAMDRKATLVARTLSDLVSQGTSVSDTDIKNFFGMGTAIMTPYRVTPTTMSQKVSALNVDSSLKVKVAWSFTATASGSSVTVSAGDAAGTTVTTVPPALLVAGTQLIMSDVTYYFTPIAGYVWKTQLNLHHVEYTRPRQSTCVNYGSAACP